MSSEHVKQQVIASLAWSNKAQTHEGCCMQTRSMGGEMTDHSLSKYYKNFVVLILKKEIKVIKEVCLGDKSNTV